MDTEEGPERSSSAFRGRKGRCRHSPRTETCESESKEPVVEHRRRRHEYKVPKVDYPMGNISAVSCSGEAPAMILLPSEPLRSPDRSYMTEEFSTSSDVEEKEEPNLTQIVEILGVLPEGHQAVFPRYSTEDVLELYSPAKWLCFANTEASKSHLKDSNAHFQWLLNPDIFIGYSTYQFFLQLFVGTGGSQLSIALILPPSSLLAAKAQSI